MGFYDRHYQQTGQGGYGSGYGGGMRMSWGLPSPSPMVKYLLIANFAVFILKALGGRTGSFNLEQYFAVIGPSVPAALQVWRLLTFQFLHADVWHIFMNMLGLFFLGSMLERAWGSRRFIIFYLVCGAVGGALFILASLLGFMGGVLVGASGGILGLLAACAILFPHVRVILILFPVPIRTAAIILMVIYTLNVIGGGRNDGGDLCHLGGMLTGFAWVYAGPFLQQWQANQTRQMQQRQSQQQRHTDFEVDRILAKVSEKGVHSLTNQEKRILREATEQRKRS